MKRIPRILTLTIIIAAFWGAITTFASCHGDDNLVLASKTPGYKGYLYCQTDDDDQHAVKYVCKVCKQEWYYYADMVDHVWTLKSHSEENNYDEATVIYECKLCGKTKTVYHRVYLDKQTEFDNTYHIEKYGCFICEYTYNRKVAHSYHDYADDVIKYDDTYHIEKYGCRYCSYTYNKKVAHSYDKYADEVIKKATLNSKGIETYTCKDCGYIKNKKFNWKYYDSDDHSTDYDIESYTQIHRNTRKVTIKLKHAFKGSVVQLKIGKKTYTKKVKSSKKITFKIAKPKWKQKYTILVKYKGKKIGSDYDYVNYANKISNGMTMEQVSWTWGTPKKKSSSSYGKTWYYKNGYVHFKGGVVDYWCKY